jgi:hypothetical protein
MAVSEPLAVEEVRQRVSSYEDTNVTDALYAFGTLLIAANRDRTKALEGKAMAVAGYGLAILAFLISREPSQSVIAPWPPGWVATASVLAALALACGGASLVIRRHAWLSDTQWFENEQAVLENEDSLRRCHVLAMHAVNRELDNSNNWKARFVFWGQMLIVGAGLCLALWLLSR